MPEAHSKPCYMLEHPKAQGASNATILVDEEKSEMDNQQATQIELGWIAGFIDGEGYIGVQEYKTRRKHPSFKCAIQISNTDEVMILKAQRIFQKIGVNPYLRVYQYGLNNRPKSKTVWILVVGKMHKIVQVLESVNPYLTGMKKERADLILEYCQSRLKHWVRGSHNNVISEREAQIVELCIAKQKRGASETTRKAQLESSELNRQKEESRRNRSNGRYSAYVSTVMI